MSISFEIFTLARHRHRLLVVERVFVGEVVARAAFADGMCGVESE